MNNDDDFLTVDEAAAVACCSTKAIRTAMRKGRLPFTVDDTAPLMRVSLIRRRDAERFQHESPAHEARRQAIKAGRG